MLRVYYKTLLVVLFGALSCTESEEPYKTVLGENSYAIDVPVRFTKRDDLHKLSYLQLSDIENSFYVVVLADSKKNLKGLSLNYNLKGYKDFVLKKLGESIRIDSSKILTYKSSGNLSSVFFEVSGIDKAAKTEGKVLAQVGVYESPRCFYQTITWTSFPVEELQIEEMQRILESFIEIKRQTKHTPIAPTGH